MAQDPFLDEIVRVSAELDRLIADRVMAGQSSQSRHEDHVDQAEELAACLVRAGRGSGRPLHPPLARTATCCVW